MFIAEMDTPLAPSIATALAESISLGDSGYASIGRLGVAYADFADRRYGWSPDPAAMRLVPDVNTGIYEVVRALTAPGDGVVIDTPAYPPFFAKLRARGAHDRGKPDGADGHRFPARPRWARARVRRRRDGLPVVQSAQPDRHRVGRRDADGDRGAGGRVRRADVGRRDSRSADLSRRKARAVSDAGRARRTGGGDVRVRVEGLEPTGTQSGAGRTWPGSGGSPCRDAGGGVLLGRHLRRSRQ